jgi:hypothetical protein
VGQYSAEAQSEEPICFSPYRSRARNLLERFKQCRRIATRYDKLAANYLSFIKVAAIRIWLRAYEVHASAISSCGYLNFAKPQLKISPMPPRRIY